MPNEVSTAPLALGTLYVEAAGNELIHYTLAVVHLYDVEGIEISGPTYNSSTEMVEYTYTYGGTQPSEGDAIQAIELPIFMPTLDGSGGYVTPLAVKITNTEDEEESATTTVLSNTPIIRPYVKGTYKVQSMRGDDDPQDNEVRWLIAKDVVGQGDGTTVTYYFMFIIVKTDTNNIRYLEYTASGTDLQVSYQANPIVPTAAVPIAAVAYCYSSADEYETITLTGQPSVSISYSNPAPAEYDYTPYS